MGCRYVSPPLLTDEISGVISYVMMAGFPPFDGENDAEVLASIVAVRFCFPSPEWEDYSDDAKNFVSSILVEDPSKRLTARQALDHPFITKHNTEEHRNVAGYEPPPPVAPVSQTLSMSKIFIEIH